MIHHQRYRLSDRLMGATSVLTMISQDVRYAEDAEKQDAVGNTLSRFIAELQQMQSQLRTLPTKETTE